MLTIVIRKVLINVYIFHIEYRVFASDSYMHGSASLCLFFLLINLRQFKSTSRWSIYKCGFFFFFPQEFTMFLLICNKDWHRPECARNETAIIRKEGSTSE